MENLSFYIQLTCMGLVIMISITMIVIALKNLSRNKKEQNENPYSMDKKKVDELMKLKSNIV